MACAWVVEEPITLAFVTITITTALLLHHREALAVLECEFLSIARAILQQHTVQCGNSWEENIRRDYM